MSFAERLRDLQRAKNVPKVDVFRSVGLSRTNYFRYETGRLEPTASKLAAFADYFNVSTDYLLGRTDNPNVCR